MIGFDLGLRSAVHLNLASAAPVIAASLGGVEALRTLVTGFPDDLPAAVLIVLHTNANSPMAMAKILGRCTAMPVAYAEQGGSIVAGRIYVAPPSYHTIVVAKGLLGLRATPTIHYVRPAADALFRSAAQIYGSRVVGVVLTGGDHDGTAGLQAVKAAGGISIIQSPDDAADSSMPTNAIRGDSPDRVVPLSRMADVLTQVVTTGSVDATVG